MLRMTYMTCPYRQKIEQDHYQRPDRGIVGSRQQGIEDDERYRGQDGELPWEQDARDFLQPGRRQEPAHPSHDEKREKGQQPQM